MLLRGLRRVNTKITRACETKHENLDTEGVGTPRTHIHHLKVPPACRKQRACMCVRAPLQFRAAAERGGRLLKMTAPPTTPQVRTNLYSCTFAKHIIKHNRVFITDCQEIPAHLHSNLICRTESSCIQEIILCAPPPCLAHTPPELMIFNMVINPGDALRRSSRFPSDSSSALGPLLLIMNFTM